MQVDQVAVNYVADLINPSLVQVNNQSRFEIHLLCEAVLLVRDGVALVHVLLEVVQVFLGLDVHLLQG